MKLSSLEIRNFRNFTFSEITFNAGINFFIGPNGFGKTSILEAVSILSHLRSFKTNQLFDCVLKNEKSAEVSGKIGNEETKINIKIDEKGKTAFINGKPIKNSISFLKQRFGNYELGFHAIVFSPDDHRVVKGEPQTRRTFLDSVISAEKPEYLENLSRYKKLLDQRNRILKTSQRTANNEELLSVFTEELIEIGADLTRRRIEWVCDVNPLFSERLKRIAPKQEECEIFYNFSGNPTSYLTRHSTIPSLDEIRESLWRRVRQEANKEWILGQTRIGPHRDDLGIGKPGQLLKAMGSQGEIRSALLALKFIEIDHFKVSTGHTPVLLLDDLSSELDSARRKELLKYLASVELQVFVTTTEAQSIMGKKFYFEKSGVLNAL